MPTLFERGLKGPSEKTIFGRSSADFRRTLSSTFAQNLPSHPYGIFTSTASTSAPYMLGRVYPSTVHCGIPLMYLRLLVTVPGQEYLWTSSFFSAVPLLLLLLLPGSMEFSAADFCSPMLGDGAAKLFPNASPESQWSSASLLLDLLLCAILTFSVHHQLSTWPDI